MNLYWASVCTIPERWDLTIWMVLGTSMSQSTPGDNHGNGKSRKIKHGEGGAHLNPPSALLRWSREQAGKSKGKRYLSLGWCQWGCQWQWKFLFAQSQHWKKEKKKGNWIVLFFLNADQKPRPRKSLALGDRRLPNYSQGLPNYSQTQTKEPKVSRDLREGTEISTSVPQCLYINTPQSEKKHQKDVSNISLPISFISWEHLKGESPHRWDGTAEFSWSCTWNDPARTDPTFSSKSRNSHLHKGSHSEIPSQGEPVPPTPNATLYSLKTKGILSSSQGKLSCFCFEGLSSPAVDHDRPCIRNALLLVVHLLQEIQDAAGIAGHAVVGPGAEVVLPHRPLRVPLRATRNPARNPAPKSIYGAQLSLMGRGHIPNPTWHSTHSSQRREQASLSISH